MADVDVNGQVFVVSDVSRVLYLFTGLDLATDAYVVGDVTARVRKPDGTYFNLTAVSIDEAAVGTIKCNTGVVGNLDQAGMYIWQVSVAHTAKPTVTSDAGHFYVESRMSGL